MPDSAGPSDSRAQQLRDSLDAVEQRVASACDAAGRHRSELTLVVVTKYFPAGDIERLATLGVRDIGENRHQEASDKIAELAPATRQDLRTHFIGQLQSNKAGAVAAYADVVQSVDRAKVARALDRGAEREGRLVDVTVQVDLAGDDAGRGGAAPADVLALAATIEGCASLRLRGLMAVAPLGADPAEAFERLHRTHEDLIADHPGATWISAGMSGDLEQAVAAGATHLRVGSAILGSRPALR
ncbi:YggS family pyridoxal phosphate-dependent enzyme [Luteipulveratus sp. YIM 133132]|uniref:Pyridoxal phosphate homeostasis protein n=1 Tax=Luteipulveratus flavus TaxID=3031728 RepID=A0ABT6C5X3_9MICO|nr:MULTISPECIES: YggS family pyridoxal phosphate-dependent enzyme [unclassified Luteipulveratus]MDE9366478.1 YggS family pyridoxal phosphate-dependent enzyme [Luteipulveratus sp. YIM 133132]MDF8264248.1 YggS family pyridoxal phosphate-dependent enzyme [Luteipulveratus sp. YIM 133296]